ncbi:MAG: hypothetical protein MK110_16200 [Fuerstiella sp.]|nr:hypothetical protein [Fuerstiella sp.]
MLSTLQPVEADVAYPLPLFMSITGQGRNALAQARRDGLTIRKRGNRKYVLGSDWIEFLQSHGTVEEHASKQKKTPAGSQGRQGVEYTING